jgi:hypothetical protein
VKLLSQKMKKNTFVGIKVKANGKVLPVLN